MNKYYKQVYILCPICENDGRKCSDCKTEGFVKAYITIREYMECGKPKPVYEGQQPPG